MDALDYNFARWLELTAVTSRSGELFETSDFVLTNNKGQAAEFNPAFLKRPAYKVARALDRALAHYTAAGVPFRLHVPADNAEVRAELGARGFTEVAPLPVLEILPEAPLAFGLPELSMRRVQDASMLGDFQRVAFESYGYPVAHASWALTEAFAAAPDAALFVGYCDERPVCCATLVRTGDLAGIYWVGTLAAARKRGLGAAATAHALREGFRSGCQRACLQATPLGLPVYRRMGFRELRCYLRFDHA